MRLMVYQPSSWAAAGLLRDLDFFDEPLRAFGIGLNETTQRIEDVCLESWRGRNSFSALKLLL